MPSSSPPMEPPPAEPSSRGERRQLTVAFCDLVGSTALSEQLDPEDLQEVLQAYYGACREIIDQFDGHIAQYLGDGLLIYFGYPVAHEDAARRAVHAALGLMRAMAELNPSLEQEVGIRLSVRVGLHTGLVVIGGNRHDRQATELAVGATPNIAARIQAATPPNAVLVSETTRELIQGYFQLEDMGRQDLRGVAEPMGLYRVLRPTEAQSRLEVMPVQRRTPFVGARSGADLVARALASSGTGTGASHVRCG
ncbi:hypothetical protein C2W62_28550 [Candidatus Entotheonella serta]|nr:hypothetical protein C2W62_28550 [Candidatus Entotheonella serta]